MAQTIIQGRVIRRKWITRDMVRADRRSLFVFGDNMQRRGYGGQAKAMRGEKNAVGVPTKKFPSMEEAAFFCDDTINDSNVCHAIHTAFERMRDHLALGLDVIIPTDGLGSGLSELEARAPKIHAMIERYIASLGEPVWEE